MMKKILVLSCLFASLNVQAQHADARISMLMNESRWFDLAQELKTTPADSVTPWVRQAGIGGVSITRSYILPQKKFRIGSGTAVLDSVGVNTGIDLHTGQLDKAAFSNGQEDGFLGLNLLEKFSKVIINLKNMYLETIP